MDKFSLFSLFVITSCVLLFVGNYLTDNFLVSSRIKNLVYRPRIFCLIITSAANLNTRARSVHESWAPNCDNYKLVMVVPEVVLNQSKLILTNATLLSGFEMTFDQMPLLQPPNYTLDRYNRLTDKIYSTLKYLYLNHNDYDWYLKADDDTFVFVENLRNFLSRKNKTSPVTYGYDFNCYVDKGYHSGGAGYVLSNEALKRIGNRLNKNYTRCANSGMRTLEPFVIIFSFLFFSKGIEDTDLASCLRKENVFPDKSVDEKGNF